MIVNKALIAAAALLFTAPVVPARALDDAAIRWSTGGSTAT
jgi:hypothetical protein